MSFDALAPHYRWMEWLLAGGKLQRCRTAFLDEVRFARSVLLLGEGNGRFLSAFTSINDSANITVVDASEGMLREAQRGLVESNPQGGSSRIHFLHADVLTWSPPPQQFDLIVSNFFFDCFAPGQLAALVPRLASAAGNNAQWLISDFRVPSRGLARWRARAIVAVMYWFFRNATGLSARCITPIDRLLEGNGFRLLQRRASEWGLLHTDLWQRIG